MNRYLVARESAGDGTLWEVVDPRGRVVSTYPMALRAAERYAADCAADDAIERQQLRAAEAAE